MTLLRTGSMRSLEALDIPKTGLKQGTNQGGEERNEGERLNGALQAAFVDVAWRVCRTAAIVLVVLYCEDERREPEVTQDPHYGREVAFVVPDRRQEHRE